MFFFTAKDGTFLYMGKDKFENESLIQWGWPEDVWFHVDNLSSAHVYVRLKPGQTWEDITEETVRDCAQLVKENSIEGCKKASVTVIYTPWANLRKDGSMAVRVAIERAVSAHALTKEAHLFKSSLAWPLFPLPTGCNTTLPHVPILGWTSLVS